MGDILKEIGLTKDELQERVVSRICEQVLECVDYDEDGSEWPVESQFRRAVDKRIQQHIDATISALAEKHVLPNVSQYIESIVLQETNQWGEKKGDPVTFIEYLVNRAEHYMTEQVNFQGKTKGEDSYSWRPHQTRIAHLIHEHLQYSISTAMKDALKQLNGSVAKGLRETVMIQLGETLEKLKVEVKA